MFFLTSCNALKNVPKGKQLLTNNTVKENNKSAKDATAKDVIRQKPNRVVKIPFTKAILWRPYLMLYNWGDPNKEKGFKHWLTKIGEPPSILDSAQTLKSAAKIGQYYFNKGYFLNEVEFITTLNKDSTKAQVTYNVFTGPQYYLNKVDYIINSPGIVDVVNKVKAESKLETGTPFTTAALEDERNRLVAALRNNGYYAFPKTLVRYEADTSVGNHCVNVTLLVGDQPASIGDSIYYIEHIPYQIKNLYVDPNFSFKTNKSSGSDSVVFKSVTFKQHDPVIYKTRFLESQIHFKPGEIYNEQKVKETYKHLSGNRVFQVADISFEKIKGDTTNGLNAYIRLEPYLKNTFSAELEGTNTAGNYGIAGVLTLASRNVFKGGEIFDISLRGGLEAQFNIDDDDNVFNTKQIGTEIGINFPRFILIPSFSQRIPKRMEPKSRIYTSLDYQTRVEFERVIVSLGLLYNWKESATKTHQINLLDLNYVYLPRIDQSYLESLEFKTGFQDNLIMAMRYTFVFDNQKLTKQRKRNFLRTSIETSGNLLATINGKGNFNQDTASDQYLVLGVPFSQYVKLDVDYRIYLNITKDHQFVSRYFAGITYNYGNSPYFAPFEKSFLAGGSNDMRGWNAYRLGPGNFPKYLYTANNTSYAAVAPIKLMVNLEYRFPIIKDFRGAFFLDMGNIWIWDRDYGTDGLSAVERALIQQGVFKFDQFYKQIAVNTGIGFRYDFGFFAFRLDLGMKIWDPSEPENQRYVLNGLKWNNMVYNIAIGYPF